MEEDRQEDLQGDLNIPYNKNEANGIMNVSKTVHASKTIEQIARKTVDASKTIEKSRAKKLNPEQKHCS